MNAAFHAGKKSTVNTAMAKRAALQIPAFDHTPKEYKGESYERVLKIRRENISNLAYTFYKDPLMIVEGKLQYIYDHTGKRYLDLAGGICTMACGHSHPRINAKVKEQLDVLTHTTTIYLHDQQSLYAEELCEKMPEGIDSVMFTSSGSEANYLAGMLARNYTKNWPIVTLKNAYHGHVGSQHLSSMNNWNFDFPKLGGVETAPFPDTYRGPFAQEDAAARYAEGIKETIDFNTSGKIALMMIEPIQGAGGQYSHPEGYIPKAMEHCHAAGGLYLSDEVQTGFGRTGTHYWGCDLKGIKPDIISMAKSIGNGLPLAAVASSKKVMDSLTGKTTFITYSANHLAVAAGREVIKIIDDEGLQQNAHERGLQFKSGFEHIQKDFPELGDIRGQGLMMGIEFVECPISKEPLHAAKVAAIWERTKELGVAFSKSGRFGNCFRVQPPMNLNEQDVDFALEVLHQSMTEVLRK